MLGFGRCSVSVGARGVSVGARHLIATDFSRNATAVNSLGWSSRSERNPRLTQAQSCPESQRDGTVLNVMTIQSAVALRLTPSLANKPGVPLDDSLHPRLLTAVAFATLEFGSQHKAGT